uniref:Glutathione transferase n=1 Tax=Hemiselmis tepida TaxID=464990 RepID=A0A7S0VAS2_9CRYP|mmetsp:Transcript_15299/g.38914  ORF Transcript_15299/g.38914 Transcript_15299/m.38914 type:complete len:217 (+) Transcript_15299:60-710(+)
MALKLSYFNLRGLAETSRMMLAISGTEYEDNRYPIDVANGFAKPEMEADKAKGVLDMNMGRLPILSVGGVEIGQSKCIERYLAKKFGMVGDNDVQAGQVDTIVEHVGDIKQAYNKAKGEADKDAAVAKWFSEGLKEWLTKLEACVAKTSGAKGCAVGSKMSYADVVIYAFLAEFFDNLDGVKASSAGCPNLLAIQEAVGANDKLKAWIAKRPQTPF